MISYYNLEGSIHKITPRGVFIHNMIEWIRSGKHESDVMRGRLMPAQAAEKDIRVRVSNCRENQERLKRGEVVKDADNLTVHERVCSACKVLKPAYEFDVKNSNPDGLRCRCRKCEKGHD